MEKPAEGQAPLRVLCLEDSPEDAELIRELLLGLDPGISVDCAATEQEFRSLLGGRAYDVILTDFNIPGIDGFASLRLAATIRPGVPVICVSGTVGEETATELIKAGAVDYVLKDRLARLPSAIERAVAYEKMRSARRQAAEELRQKKREMENFLYITTHDLRAPLLNIQGFSRHLLRDFEALLAALKPAVLPEEVRDKVDELAGEHIPAALGFITGSVKKMDQLINSLLKVYREGRVEMHPEALDANVVFKSVLETLSYQLAGADAEVEIGDLPPCTADAAALNHVFLSLLKNAIKFRDKSRRLEITVRGEKKGADAVLYVISDNGTGIKAAALPGLWQIFSGDRTSGPGAGEGIAMAMCRLMLEKNGGSIRAESKEGEGAAFFIELPCQP